MNEHCAEGGGRVIFDLQINVIFDPYRYGIACSPNSAACEPQLGLIVNDGDAVDLDQHAGRQRGHLDCGSRGHR